MKRSLRFVTWSLWGLIVAVSGSMACSHDTVREDKSAVSVTDEAENTPVVARPETSRTEQVRANAAATTDKVKVKAKKAVKRTQEAAARTAAAVDEMIPSEGSDEEYAADVDAVMGDQLAPVTTDATRSPSASEAIGTVADNSRVNRLSDGDRGVSADQQGNSKSDIEITRKIRRSITSNRDLSVYAHNVKIITRDGRVVLKGPVRSETERKIIEDTAVTIAGIDNVTSGIEVTAR